MGETCEKGRVPAKLFGAFKSHQLEELLLPPFH